MLAVVVDTYAIQHDGFDRTLEDACQGKFGMPLAFDYPAPPRIRQGPVERGRNAGRDALAKILADPQLPQPASGQSVSHRRIDRIACESSFREDL